MNSDGAERAGRSIVSRMMKLNGKALDDYMHANFKAIWNDYDVLKTDMVEVEQMSSFYKKLIKDQTAQI